MKITVELTAEQWAEILWAAQNACDCGYPGEDDYQSDELKSASLALWDDLAVKGLPRQWLGERKSSR